jgi:hypothetical protein
MKTLKLARDKNNYYSIYSLRLLFINCVDFQTVFFFCIKYIHIKPLLSYKSVSKIYESIHNMKEPVIHELVLNQL